MTAIVNLTPHSLALHNDKGVIDIPPSGTVARLSVKRESLAPIVVDSFELQVFKTVHGPVQDLPDPQDDTIFVVSALVAATVNRADVFSPGPLVRDDQGKVVGAYGLTAYA